MNYKKDIPKKEEAKYFLGQAGYVSGAIASIIAGAGIAVYEPLGELRLASIPLFILSMLSFGRGCVAEGKFEKKYGISSSSSEAGRSNES